MPTSEGRYTILVILAHPDDEAFGTGGTLSRYAAEGHDVYLVTATRGEAGEIAEPDLATKANLPDVRERELRCACEVYGIHEPILLNYVDGEKAYILAPKGLKVGDQIVAGEKADIRPGNALPCAKIPQGTVVHNLELYPGKGGQLCRAAGTYAQLVDKEGKYALVKLPSGEIRKVLQTCFATVGQVGNIEHENISIGKAGRNRYLNKRPKVRGVAMNPIDHPLGGGEGRSSGGRHPVTPWGVPTKGYKTRNRKKASSKFIVKRRSK